MKKALCIIALGAISYGSVFAHGTIVNPVKGVMQTDTTKKDTTTKKKVKVKTKKEKDGAVKKDSTVKS